MVGGQDKQRDVNSKFYPFMASEKISLGQHFIAVGSLIQEQIGQLHLTYMILCVW